MNNTTSSSKSKNRDEENNIEPLSDLVVDILLKSPIKSIAKFRSLSKLYASTIRGQNFTESFFTISSSRPKLLFICLKDGEVFFFSSPQPQNTSSVTLSFHMKFPFNCYLELPRPIHGFVCWLNSQVLEGRTVTTPMICNPSTGQSLNLPRVRTMRTEVISYLGYDPIHKQFKILSMTQPRFEPYYYTQEHQVLTLETGTEPKWRMIKCDIRHCPLSVDYRHRQGVYDGICISGVIYYLALAHDGDGFPDIFCFDVRSEKFHLIKRAQGMNFNYESRIINSTLVNYKGGLATLQPSINTGAELWVLEEAEKHQWSIYSYVLPPPWMDKIAETKLCFVGITKIGEIVMSSRDISDSFYLLYYNPETNDITRVDIQGLEAFKLRRAYIFLDHVENVKLIADV